MINDNMDFSGEDEYYSNLITQKELFDLAVEEYKKIIRLFFKQYKKLGFNGVINICEIDLKHFNNPCVVKLGYQVLPRQAVCDFCKEFNFYMPTIEFIEQEYDGVKFTLKTFYTFRKKK